MPACMIEDIIVTIWWNRDLSINKKMSYSEEEVAKVLNFFSLFCIMNMSSLFDVRFHDKCSDRVHLRHVLIVLFHYLQRIMCLCPSSIDFSYLYQNVFVFLSIA